MRDETKNATEVDMASTKLVRTVSKVDVDVGTHLSEQQAITDAFSKFEASTHEVERVKLGSNNLYSRRAS